MSTTNAADLPPSHPDRRAVERRLLWKVDLILMPILTITLGLQYYDKAALGSAAAFGILKDLVSRAGCSEAVDTTSLACSAIGC